MDKQYDVFISYGRKDYEIEYQENGNIVKKLIPNNPILQIVEALNEAGISCWYDQEGVSTDFLKYIKQKIDSSRVMIFVSSQYSNQSVYTADEIARALQLRMPIVPFKIDKTEFNEDFALGLASKNTIDIFMTNPKKALADLVICVQKSLEQVHKKEAEKLRKKQEEERRAEKERQIMEQEQRRRAELYEYKARLQDVQTRLLKTRNQCEELELEERKLKEAIKRLEIGDVAARPAAIEKKSVPLKWQFVLVALLVVIVACAGLYAWIGGDTPTDNAEDVVVLAPAPEAGTPATPAKPDKKTAPKADKKEDNPSALDHVSKSVTGVTKLEEKDRKYLQKEDDKEDAPKQETAPEVEKVQEADSISRRGADW